MLDPIEFKIFLENLNINCLYHANTVMTSNTFLEQGGLISRGAVRRNNLIQTWQPTDETDIKFDIFDDIFLDSCDIHNRSSSANKYGPILFKLNLSFLNCDNIALLRVTKSNPIHWTESMTDSDKYFSSIEEFEENFDKYSFGQMIMIRIKDERLSFENCLEEIIIDNPSLSLTVRCVTYFKKQN